jgi:hypothetical protein
LVAAGISRSRRDAFYWLGKTDRGLVELALQEFTGGFAKVSAVGWLTLLAGAALVAAAVYASRERVRDDERSKLAVAATWGLLPGAILLVVSFFEPVFYPRYVILSLPGLCLLAALAVDRLWKHRGGMAVAAACLAVIAGLAIFADTRQVHEIQENWRPIATWLEADRAPGQPTIVDTAIVLPSLGYYDPAFSARNGDLVVQEWHDEPLPAGFVGYKDRTGYGSVPDGPPSAATFARLAARGGGSVWMIVAETDDELQSNPRTGAAIAWARGHCHVEVRESIGVWALHASGCR